MKTIRKAKPQNAIIYNGPSLIDGKPIVVVCIVKSGNVKTGNMVQTHILRADVNPLEASKTGEDYSICGDCMHRGKPSNEGKIASKRTCYVNLGQGPNQVYKSFIKGNYATLTDAEAIANLGYGRMVRLGTYGDPSAVPHAVWDALLRDSIGHTGYTHQHNKTPDYSRLMYSADNETEASKAHKKGIRTFRVIPIATWQAKQNNALLKDEILCPASNEAGKKVTCDKCKLCEGSNKKGKSIAIVAHGIGRNMVT